MRTKEQVTQIFTSESVIDNQAVASIVKWLLERFAAAASPTEAERLEEVFELIAL